MTTLLTLLVACSFDEDLPERDIEGTVVIPRAAVTRQALSYSEDADGNPVYTSQEVTDPRLIGPVILGAFSGMDESSFDYPHPRMGPIVTADEPGDTFPFGGTTVGRVDFACYESLKGKVSTGRFTSYDDVLGYFRDLMGLPVTDSRGDVVDYASTFQQYCFEYFYYTSDSELSFLTLEDELDFVENGDGDFEAPFLMPHTVYSEGMVLWGWMDAPTISADNPDVNGSFTTCEEVEEGRKFERYDQEYYEGRFGVDLLGHPSQYIREGDWVAEEAPVVDDPDASYTINLNFAVEE